MATSTPISSVCHLTSLSSPDLASRVVQQLFAQHYPTVPLITKLPSPTTKAAVKRPSTLTSFCQLRRQTTSHSTTNRPRASQTLQSPTSTLSCPHSPLSKPLDHTCHPSYCLCSSTMTPSILRRHWDPPSSPRNASSHRSPTMKTKKNSENTHTWTEH